MLYLRTLLPTKDSCAQVETVWPNSLIDILKHISYEQYHGNGWETISLVWYKDNKYYTLFEREEIKQFIKPKNTPES